jgi:hypothetical protein
MIFSILLHDRTLQLSRYLRPVCRCPTVSII